ncbi:Fur family transcriptional regulator [Chloroflexota bacterium]
MATLRQHGYKLTPQRRVVIKAIASNQEHLTPAVIYEKVRQRQPNIGLVTIYRTLEILGKLKLICELHAGDNCRSYTISAPGHHHHLICSNCDKVVALPNCELEAVQRSLAKQAGFRIDGHLLEFIGLCPVCQKKGT